MSFQLPFESTRINKFLESKRKIIPSSRSGIREASLAELALPIKLSELVSSVPFARLRLLCTVALLLYRYITIPESERTVYVTVWSKAYTSVPEGPGSSLENTDFLINNGQASNALVSLFT